MTKLTPDEVQEQKDLEKLFEEGEAEVKPVPPPEPPAFVPEPGEDLFRQDRKPI